MDNLSHLGRVVIRLRHFLRFEGLYLILTRLFIYHVVRRRDVACFLADFRGDLLVVRLNGLFFHFQCFRINGRFSALRGKLHR